MKIIGVKKVARESKELTPIGALSKLELAVVVDAKTGKIVSVEWLPDNTRLSFKDENFVTFYLEHPVTMKEVERIANERILAMEALKG